MVEMEQDNAGHMFIYEKLGISFSEGQLIDLYQNKGRFLYKYAGSLMEEITLLCFKEKYPEACKTKIENIVGTKPKNFEIDCLIGTEAYEIKWRDATTDGDHINKEHMRISNIVAHGLTPVRLMFYQPNRSQAIKIQSKLKSLYHSVGGRYYSGVDAWNHLEEKTTVDLLNLLEKIQ